ncbi:probable tRNA N6-adenosine threonylcarbamoyltransferase, mitochondrial [Aphidius gifuensis]|uniref:probable tRNA N6-adenosine threonylcarbamoyltransferase, mitochondrial n=1 Tax=Aphidius gifuensis TaxID=684658 RepID=UPI001CDC8D8F|nr:probable tRNA N6-adenosine threonylcarbamoyltransferase, mitochondrial [Aphidius gifuensis]
MFFNHCRPIKILGIETSCDDTGVAIVDDTGKIIGQALCSQQKIHTRNGGIIPPVARDLHYENITKVCEDALKSANLKLRDIDAIATTVKPGLPLSLDVGNKFGKYLCQIGNKPYIPIHHMEAHALTARMVEKVELPFLVLLISGGHCLLALVKKIDDFYLLGTSLDDAPGEAFDKVARKLKIFNLPQYRDKNGGAVIEHAAKFSNDPLQFEFPVPMPHYRDCNFSFSGIKNTVNTIIWRQEKEFDICGDGIVPDLYNICAGFQLSVGKHIGHKTKRAMKFLDHSNLIPDDRRTLVVSGGVACNDFIAKCLNVVCEEMDYRLVRPPPQLCTDNGIMIAWNGIERWRENCGVIRDPDEIAKVDIEHRSPLGTDWIPLVKEADIQCSTIKTKQLLSIL